MNTVSEKELNQNYLQLLNVAYGEELTQKICDSFGLKENQMPLSAKEQIIAA